ncbi:AMP-binding protein [Leptothoe kymatousa]|uniref:AMP-binding protein n=1 Tax=Leptothoe kymatousa TAU-MAC 1615 TaxID=2364775 RepID=A0ABS5Y336_9CYAN|nr:AMP-binding protein [Leptothoe kymatousa]MBT9311923.1 AMP-binding protein [Leptothoe kymatousa TAU-MAC 1615]
MAAARLAHGQEPSDFSAAGQSPHEIWGTLTAPWCSQVQAIPPNSVILINEPQPEAFLAHLWSGLLANAAIILANPSWQQQEWQQVAPQISPDIVLGQGPPVKLAAHNPRPQPGQILIATGGSSGHIKFVVHTWATLSAAAQGFLDHFGLTRVNSYCVLPLHHVSGLMQALRVWLCGGRLMIQPFKQLAAGTRLVAPDKSWFISLVPTQLQRLLNADAGHWLQQFHGVLLGGAPAWPHLLAQAKTLPIALTYGMSETAAQVATLPPQDFYQGVRSNGPPLPHVQLAIHGLDTPEVQPAGTVGRIALRTPSLGLGYWPHNPIAIENQWFYPDDLGYLDTQGHLHVVGRNSQKIITGGENVFPAEVEAALLATGLVTDVWVGGLADQLWGQAVAVVYVSKSGPQPATPKALKIALKPLLSGYKHPKYWHSVDRIPRNPQGKVNRQQMVALLHESTAAVDRPGRGAGG